LLYVILPMIIIVNKDFYMAFLYRCYLLMLLVNLHTIYAKDETFSAGALAQKQLPLIPATTTISDKKYPNTHVGILPIIHHGGKAYILLGKNARGEWGDFGTSWQGHSSYLQTALSAFAKQTRYVFGKLADDVQPLEKLVPKNKLDYYQKRSMQYAAARVIKKEVTNEKKSSYLFLVYVDWVPEGTFNNAASVQDQKTNYEWVPVDAFMKAMHDTQNRWQATYLNKQISRHLYTTCHDAYDTIMATIYPSQQHPPTTFKEPNSTPAPLTTPILALKNNQEDSPLPQYTTNE
jgi:hypothetical protein